MVADVPPWTAWGKKYREFGGWGMAAEKGEVLLMVSGLNVVRIATSKVTWEGETAQINWTE